MASKERTKKSATQPERRTNTTTAKSSTTMRGTGATSAAAQTRGISEEERGRMIAEAAYFRSANRGYEPGHELEDWLAAEAEVNEKLKTASR